MKLKKRRIAKGLTQKSLAKMAGVQQCQISKIERGLSSPRLKTAKRIAKALEVNWSEIYEEDDGEER